MKKYLFISIFLCSGLFGIATEHPATHGATIVVYTSEFGPADTMVLYVWDDLLLEVSQQGSGNRLYKAANKGGKFTFNIDQVSSLSYFTLGMDDERRGGIMLPILERYLMEPRDSIVAYMRRVETPYPSTSVLDSGKKFKSNTRAIVFSGRGAAKYNCRFLIDQALTLQKQVPVKTVSNKTSQLTAGQQLRQNLEAADKRYAESLQILEKHRNSIKDTVFQLLNADVLGMSEYTKLRPLELYAFQIIEPRGTNENFQDTINVLYEQFFKKENEHGLPMDIAFRSPYYIRYLVSKYTMDQVMAGHGFSATEYFLYIKDHVKAPIRDRILTYFLVTRGASGNREMDGLVAYLYDKTTDQTCKKMLHLLVNRARGNIAYSFSLPDVNGNLVSLDNLKGKVVLIDFWYAACGPCQKYYQNVVNPVHHQFLEYSDVVFVSICTDRYDVFKKVVQNGNFTSSDAINLYTDNQGFEHKILKNYGIISFPFPIVVGKDGTIRATGSALRTKEGLIEAIELARAQ